MQSTKVHHEKLTLAALDAVIEWVRDQARRDVRYGGAAARAVELRDLNEFLLRPMRELVAQLTAVGGSQVEPAPAEVKVIQDFRENDSELPPDFTFSRCRKCTRFARHNFEGRCLACGAKRRTSQNGAA